jgi:serine/alanine adding enzyme
MYTIRVATDNDRDTWEAISNLILPNNHFFSWNWKNIIQSTFGHIPYYLIIESESKAIGICPIFFVKSILFGTALISVPYINGGGIYLLDNNALSFTLKYISDLQKELNCNYTELRNRDSISNSPSSLSLRTHKVSMQLKLNSDPEKLFSSFSPKLRSQIRRPTKEGCTSVIVDGKSASNKQISDFYSVFSQNMKTLGTPVYSKKLFTKTLKLFGKDSLLAVIYNHNQPVAGGITLRSGNSVEIPWAASLRSKSHYAPNMLLYWELLKHCCLTNVEIFDFGRSTKDAGTYKFKAQWGSIPSNLHWYYPIESKSIPEINPHSKKFELLVSIWKKIPLIITKIIGPTITKSLP